MRGQQTLGITFRVTVWASFDGSHTEITPMGFEMVDEGLFTIAGGEDVHEPSIGTAVRVKWSKCALLLLYCGLIVLTTNQICLSGDRISCDKE